MPHPSSGANGAAKRLALTLAASLLAVALAVPPAAQGVAVGYYDTTERLPEGEAREPLLTTYSGQLWSIFQYRTNLVNAGGEVWGQRGEIFYSVFDGFGNWSNATSITPGTRDVAGQGVHGPAAAEYRGRLYVTFESVEPSLKDDDANTDNDILLRVFDGSGWDPPLDRPAHVLSQPNDSLTADQECRCIVYDDKLFVVWSQAPDPGELNGTLQYCQMVFRTFDGSAWSPIRIAARQNASIFGGPSLAVWRDRLWLVFHTNTSAQTDMDIDACSFDGSAWTAPARINPVIEGYPQKRQNENARTAVFDDRLWVAWQSEDTFAKSTDNWDILLSSYNGSSWSYPLQVNRPDDQGQDIWPDLRGVSSKLYIVWSSDDPLTTDGQRDTDVMVRAYDGHGWDDTGMVSPWGDNGTIEGEHNPGDDNFPSAWVWNGSLYCTWMAYDQVDTGHAGGGPSVMVRQITGRPVDTVPQYIPGGSSPAASARAALSWPLAALAAALVAGIVAAAIAPMLMHRRKGAPGAGPGAGRGAKVN